MSDQRATSGGPVGYIRLHLQGSPMLSMITPTVRLNGYPVPAGYGENVLQAWAGANTVSLQSQWLWQYGRVEMTVDVAPGQVVDVWYAAPLNAYMSGNVGLTKQKHKGVGLLVAVGALLALVIVAIVVAAVASS